MSNALNLLLIPGSGAGRSKSNSKPPRPKTKAVSLTPADRYVNRINEIGEETGFGGQAVFQAIQAMSGNNPRARDADGRVGLLKFSQADARKFGTTVKRIAQMDALQQLELVRQKLSAIQPGGHGFADLNAALNAPTGFGQPGTTGLFPTNQPRGRNFGRDPRSMDANRDGMVSKDEYAAAALRGAYMPADGVPLNLQPRATGRIEPRRRGRTLEEDLLSGLQTNSSLARDAKPRVAQKGIYRPADPREAFGTASILGQPSLQEWKRAREIRNEIEGSYAYQEDRQRDEMSLGFLEPARFVNAVVHGSRFVESHRINPNLTKYDGYLNRIKYWADGSLDAKDAEVAAMPEFEQMPIEQAAKYYANIMGLPSYGWKNLLNPKTAAFRRFRELTHFGQGSSKQKDDVRALALSAGADRTSAGIIGRDPDIGNATTAGLIGRSVSGALSPTQMAGLFSGDIRTADEVPAWEQYLNAGIDFAAQMVLFGGAAAAAEKFGARAALRAGAEGLSPLAARFFGRAGATALEEGGAGAITASAVNKGTAEGLRKIALKGLSYYGRNTLENAAMQVVPAYGQAADLTAKNGKAGYENFAKAMLSSANPLASLNPQVLFDPSSSHYEKAQTALALGLQAWARGIKGYGWALRMAREKGLDPQAVISPSSTQNIDWTKPYPPEMPPSTFERRIEGPHRTVLLLEDIAHYADKVDSEGNLRVAFLPVERTKTGRYMDGSEMLEGIQAGLGANARFNFGAASNLQGALRTRRAAENGNRLVLTLATGLESLRSSDNIVKIFRHEVTSSKHPQEILTLAQEVIDALNQSGVLQKRYPVPSSLERLFSILEHPGMVMPDRNIIMSQLIGRKQPYLRGLTKISRDAFAPELASHKTGDTISLIELEPWDGLRNNFPGSTFKNFDLGRWKGYTEKLSLAELAPKEVEWARNELRDRWGDRKVSIRQAEAYLKRSRLLKNNPVIDIPFDRFQFLAADHPRWQ